MTCNMPMKRELWRALPRSAARPPRPQRGDFRALSVRITPVSAAPEGRRLDAEVIPPCAGCSPTFARSWNSSSPPLGAAGEPGSPSCCREMHVPRLGPAGPSSSQPRPACSTCPEPRPSGRGRSRGGDRHSLASPIPSSYCLCSCRVARRALMIRTRPRAEYVLRRVHAASQIGRS